METKIVISGSFRKHLIDIGRTISNFKKSGVEVLAPLTNETIDSRGDDFVFLRTDDLKKPADVLGEEFMANIEKADFLYLADIDGYVGQSAGTEMGFAILKGVPIIAAEEIRDISKEIPEVAQQILRKSVFKQFPINEIGPKIICELNLANFIPVALTHHEKTLLQSLVEKLLKSLESANIAL